MSRRAFILAAIIVGTFGLWSGMTVGQASAAPAQTLNGYAVPTCTTSQSVTLGGVCEDFAEPTANLTDTGNSWDTGSFGTMFTWLFNQLFSLVTQNLAVLLLWLAAWLTFVVFGYLGRKSGSDDEASNVVVYDPSRGY